MKFSHRLFLAVAGCLLLALPLAALLHVQLSPAFALPFPDWSARHDQAYALLATGLCWWAVLPACWFAAQAWLKACSGMRTPHPGLLVLAMVGGGLLCAGPALRTDFHFDDLFLLRPYTLGELASAWTGTWDPNGVLRPAYRPLMTLGAASAYALLGETPWLHRVFNAGIFAVGWVLFFRAVAGPARFSRLAIPLLLLWLSSSSVSIFAGWITEGYRALHLLLFSLALTLLRRALPDLPARGLALALLAFSACLLTREEAVPLALGLAGLIYVCARRAENGNPVPRARWAIALFLLAPCALIALRLLLVPSAERLEFSGPPRLLGLALSSFPLFGLPVLAILVLGWRGHRGDRPYIVACLGQAVAASLPGVGMVRVDVALFPLLFLLAACAPGIQHLMEATPATRRLLLAILLAGFTFGLPSQWLRMRDLLPESLPDILRNCRVLHGDLHEQGARVPPARRARLEARYAQFGVPAGSGFAGAIQREMDKALAESRFTPAGPGQLFRHAWDFLSSQPGTHKVFRLQARREAERRAAASLHPRPDAPGDNRGHGPPAAGATEVR